MNRLFFITLVCVAALLSAPSFADVKIGKKKEDVITEVFQHPGAFLYKDSLLRWSGKAEQNLRYYTLYKFRDGVTISESRSSDPIPESENKQWFGLGVVTGIGKYTKTKETTRIANRPGEAMLWIVDTDLRVPTDFYIHAQFPNDDLPDNLPPSAKVEGKTVVIPAGKIPVDQTEGKLILDLHVDQGDPSGVYKIFVADDSGIIAGLSYRVGDKEAAE